MGRPFEGRRWRLEVKLNSREQAMLTILRDELGETTDGGTVRRLLADAFDALPRRCHRRLTPDDVTEADKSNPGPGGLGWRAWRPRPR